MSERLTDDELRDLKKNHRENPEENMCRAMLDGCCIGYGGHWPCVVWQMIDEIQRLRILEEVVNEARKVAR